MGFSYEEGWFKGVAPWDLFRAFWKYPGLLGVQGIGVRVQGLGFSA